MNAKLTSALFVILLFVGCAGLQMDTNQSVVYGIETAAVVIGYYAAQQPDLDMVLRNLYEVATKGRLTAEGVNEIMNRLDMKNEIEALLVRRILRLAELVGATVIEGKIVDVAGVSPEFLSAVARGYVDGYDTFVLSEVER